MTGIYWLGLALTAGAAIDALRRDRVQPWLWIILFFPTVGAVIYLVSEYGGGGLSRLGTRLRPVSGREFELAAANVKRLDTANAWTEYAMLLRRKRRTAEALAAATRAVERDGESLEARYELGRSLLDSGRAQEAVAALQQALSRDRFTEQGEGLFALAQAQAQSGDAATALGSLAALTQRHPTPPFLWERARVEAAAGDQAAARATLERLVDDAQYVPKYMRSSVRPWVRRARQRLREL